MKVLIFGGTRYFGKRLISHLISHGHQVSVVTRGNQADDFGKSIQRIRGDRTQLNTIAEIKGEFDIVFDQVCYEAKDAKAAVELFSNRVGRYIFTSSESVYKYGADIKEAAFDPFEYRYQNAVTKEQDYAEGKRQCETEFTKAKFSVGMVRLPIVLGPDDYTFRLKFHVDKLLGDRKIFFPNIDAKISFVHVDDAGKFLFNFGCNSKITGPINYCAPLPIALKDLLTQIESHTASAFKLLEKPEEGCNSPFGIESDWWMNTDRAICNGLRAREVSDWLPELIVHYLRK